VELLNFNSFVSFVQVMATDLSNKRASATDLPLIMIVVLSLLGLIGIMGSLFFVTQDYLEKSTIQVAARYSEVIREFRSIYTSRVVAKAVANGMQATHDFENSANAIPLPATFTKMLGERLGNLGSGAETRLYSDYPFPWRKKGGPRDEFEKAALKSLRKSPDQPYTRLEVLDGQQVLRYATADVMTAACVTCHNSHAESPKRDWRVSDIRGVLEIILPVRTSVDIGLSSLDRAFLLSGIVSLLGVVALVLIVWRYRRRAYKYADNARFLGRELEQIQEHRNQILDTSLDGIISVDAGGNIIDFNPSAERIFKRSFEEAIGKPVADLIIPETHRKNHLDGFQRYLETGDSNVVGYRRELTAMRQGGEEFPIELTLMENTLEGQRTFSAFIRDITEQKSAQKAQMESEGRFRDYAESAADRFWETDAEYVVTYVSPPNGSLSLAEEEIVGKTHWDEKTWPSIDSSGIELMNAFQTREPFHGQPVSWAWPDGTETHVLMNGIPKYSNDGNFLGYRGSTINISGEMAAHKGLEKAKIQAESANRAKSEFLANVSHELRTPLNAVIGFTEVLQGKSFVELQEEKQQEYLTIIKDSGEHLLNLINDILDVARIEDGKMEPVAEELEFGDIAGNCLILISSRAEDKDLKLIKVIEPDLPRLFVDERMMKQIILNLLSNAVKFSTEGGKILLTASLNEQGEFYFSVSDEGIGMDEQGIETALTKFGQVDGSFERNQDGTGLGLPLVLGLVKAHGGEIDIKSEIGQGTTIRVTLPKDRLIN